MEASLPPSLLLAFPDWSPLQPALTFPSSPPLLHRWRWEWYSSLFLGRFFLLVCAVYGCMHRLHCWSCRVRSTIPGVHAASSISQILSVLMKLASPTHPHKAPLCTALKTTSLQILFCCALKSTAHCTHNSTVLKAEHFNTQYAIGSYCCSCNRQCATRSAAHENLHT